MAFLIVVAAALFVPLVFVLVQYNALVGLRNHIRDAWSNVGTELQRRYDLIPNLVASVKGYASHEEKVLERVTELRNACLHNHGSSEEQESTERQLVGALQHLLALVENYPQLKADQHFLDLQKELINTEDRIQAARRFYNGNIRDYRIKCESFPSNIVASMFGFESRDYFNVEPSVREVPNVQFPA